MQLSLLVVWQEQVEQILRIWIKEKDPDIAKALPTTYQQLLAVMEKAYGHSYYLYDVCDGKLQNGKPCCLIYRCEFRDMVQCPRCSHARFHETKAGRRPNRTMPYHRIRAFIETLFADPALARYALACVLDLHYLHFIP
jgi:hypothetical protein